jgi:hypothetical protein
MATFGSLITGSNNVSAPPANDKAVSSFSIQYDGTVDTIAIDYGSYTGHSKAVIYDSTGVGGLPGALLGVSAEITAITGGFGVYTFSPQISLTAAGSPYWIGIWSDTGNSLSCVSLTNGIAYNSNTYSSGGNPTNPFGASPSQANFQYPIIARYTPNLSTLTNAHLGEFLGGDGESSATIFANNLAVIPTPYSVTGTISSITYFVSQAYGSAKVKPVLYDNTGAGGTPGSLIAVGPEVTGVVQNGNTIPFSSPVSVSGIIYFGLFTDTAQGCYARSNPAITGYNGSQTYGTAPSTFPGSPSSSTNHPACWVNGSFAPTSARSGGVVREVIRVSTGSAHAGGVVREVIRASTPRARVSGVVREALVQDQAPGAARLKTGGVVREALVTSGGTSPATRAIVDGLVREALVFTVGGAHAVAPRPWLRAHFLLEQDLEEEWRPRRRVTVPSTPPVTVHLRPYLQINT